MSMSFALSCSHVGGWPTPSAGAGDCLDDGVDDCAGACAYGRVPLTIALHRNSAVAVRDRAVTRDLPDLNAVVVIIRIDAADFDQIRERRLCVAGVVGAAG